MNTTGHLIMIVDDNVTNIQLLAGTLKAQYRLAIVKSGKKALEFTRHQLPDLILLDIMMPEMSGFEVCEHLKKDSRTREIPIIFITAINATDQKTKGFGMGAVDYITKPFHAAEVLARVHTHLSLRKMHEVLEEKNSIIAHALDEKSRQLDTLIDNLPGMVYRSSFDGDWHTTFVSDGCQALTGYLPNAFTSRKGRHYDLIILDKERGGVGKKIDKALANRTDFGETYRIQTASKQEKWVWEQGVGIYDQKGKLAGIEGFISDITEKQKGELALRRENSRLKSRILKRDRFDDIIGASPVMQKVYDLILKAAVREDNVIIYGPSGTGKELVAKAIHTNSHRSKENFVPVNCGAIHESLFESEFFGHKKGAFSGASTDKIGILDKADGGTLFLDELGEISLAMQVKLLRVMDGNGFIPVGGTVVKKPDIRFVAATNRDLTKMVRKKRIREDFFFRIHIIPITLPSLKARKEDIPKLIEHFLDSYPKNEDMSPVTPEIISAMTHYHWPGNVRQLQNALYQYLTIGELEFLDPGLEKGTDRAQDREEDLKNALETFEKRFIETVLIKYEYRKLMVADKLGINRKTLFRKIKHHDIKI
jgi:DNA-binding NtrC family response regulator